jgi:phospholipase C
VNEQHSSPDNNTRPDNNTGPNSNTSSDRHPAPGRRRLLQGALLAGAVAGTGAWRMAPGDARRPARARAHLRQPGSRPYPGRAAGADTIPQIKHIVVLMMENHSYDNKLGMLKRAGADGFTFGADGKPTATNPYANGDIQHAFRMPTTCQISGKPSQTWHNSHTSFDNGKNDGFVKSASGAVAMGYWQWADQPFYYSVAKQFPIADRYFCSLLGQTFPNRRFLMSGTSMGMVNDGVPDPLQYPKNGTIFDALNKHRISWKDYCSLGKVLTTTELYPKLYVENLSKIVSIDHFYSDVAAGKLPSFSLVEPNYLSNSEEDPQSVAVGEEFAAKVINALISSPSWKNTMLIWTYDEHGGYYDHVPPPAAIAPDNIPPDTPGGDHYNGFKQYGFRVPCAVISPWARPDYVSHEIFDHTSICSLVEHKWNLPAMTHRDANASPMLDMLDLSSPAFLTPPSLAKPLVDTDPKALTCQKTGPGTIPPPGSVTKPKRSAGAAAG